MLPKISLMIIKETAILKLSENLKLIFQKD